MIVANQSPLAPSHAGSDNGEALGQGARSQTQADPRQLGQLARICARPRAEGLNDSYATRLLRLAYLAPSIVDTILDSRQPSELSAIRLMRGDPLPMDWQKQRARLGYP